MDANNLNFDKDNEKVARTDDSALFGTSSSDIIRGLQAEAFTDSAVSDLPDDDDQIVNEQDQQDITNQPEEEIQPVTPQPESTTPGIVPGLERDLLDKTVLNDRDDTNEENINDVKAT
jgi:hypothetical protein